MAGPARLVRLHRLERDFELAARGARVRLRRADLGGELGRLGREARQPFARLLFAGRQRAELRAQVDVAAVQTIDRFLSAVARFIERRDSRARLEERTLAFLERPLGRADRRTDRAQFLLAFDDAGVHVLVAADAQPVPADPDAVAGDDGFAGRKRGAARQRLVETVDRVDAAQQ